MKSHKEYYKEMQKIAKNKGGKCLSSEYINNYSKMLWECEEGHQWEATANNIKSESWCPYCAKNRIVGDPLQNLQKFAKDRGGKCLSIEYVNCKTKMLWECEEGHQWEATADNITNGSWCKKCVMNKRSVYSLEGLNQIAKNKGGKCISIEYENCKTKMLWECEERHQWEAAAKKIMEGTWCPYCSKNRIYGDALKALQEIAESRGGKCLSIEYVNCKTKMLWECKEGHIWQATANKIKSGSWCKKCVNILRRGDALKVLQEIAESKGGKCLSIEYVNCKTKMLWECEEGHQWEATADYIKSEKWCEQCSRLENLENFNQITKI